MAEKTEQPTEKRKKDSAKKGQTFKSKDITGSIVLIVGLFYLNNEMSFQPIITLCNQVFVHPLGFGVSGYLFEIMKIFFKMTLPFVGVCFLAGALVTLMQTRFALATEALKLNLQALNPVEGFKKVFSIRSLKELVKALIYLVTFSITCYSFMSNDVKMAISTVNGSIYSVIYIWQKLVVNAVMMFIVYSIVALLADFLVEFFLHSKELKMDKHEVKQEMKEMDGDPKIKHARRQMHAELLSGSEMEAIRSSEVVLANPTHIAIAIYMNPEVALFPFIALRCTDAKAKAAIAYAKKIGVPVVRYKPLARKLYNNYKQFSFISINDSAVMEILEILMWLHQVEATQRPDVELEYFGKESAYYQPLSAQPKQQQNGEQNKEQSDKHEDENQDE